MFRLLLLFGVMCCAVPGVASAQAGIDAIMNKIIQGTPGITNVAITGGVRAGAAGSVGVAAGGFTIPVATAVTADVSYAAIALGAGRVALRIVPWVGAALTIAEIAREVKGSGIVTCAPPDFFCKPGPSTAGTVSAGGWTLNVNGVNDASPYATAQAACDVAYSRATVAQQASWGPMHINMLSANTGTCTGSSGIGYGGINAIKATCTGGSVLSADGYSCTLPGSLVPATVPDLQTQLNTGFAANASLALAMKQNIDSLQQQNPGTAPAIDYTSVPSVVTAPSVTSDPKVISTTTIPNPDGTTSTQKVTQQTTVTPVISTPSTVTAPNVSYPSTTTTTTTTTNNSTNVVTTNVTNVNNPPPVTTPDALKIPTDYNRETTQLAILQKVTDFTGPITATAPDGQKDLDTVQAKNVEGTTAVDGISQASTGLQGWFPTIATSTCRNPVVPNAIGGGTTAVPICDSVNIFSQFISAVICVFALFGCVREVQSALKA